MELTLYGGNVPGFRCNSLTKAHAFSANIFSKALEKVTKKSFCGYELYKWKTRAFQNVNN